MRFAEEHYKSLIAVVLLCVVLVACVRTEPPAPRSDLQPQEMSTPFAGCWQPLATGPGATAEYNVTFTNTGAYTLKADGSAQQGRYAYNATHVLILTELNGGYANVNGWLPYNRTDQMLLLFGSANTDGAGFVACKQNAAPPYVMRKCFAPTIENGPSCCLDNDSDGICDQVQEHRFIPEKCSVSPPLSCREYQAAGKTLQFIMQSHADSRVQISQLSIENCTVSSYDTQVESGSMMKVLATCQSLSEKETRRFPFTLKVSYDDGRKTDVQGSIQVRAS